MKRGDIVKGLSGLEYQLISIDDEPCLVLNHDMKDLARKGFEVEYISKVTPLVMVGWIPQEEIKKTLESWNK